MKNTKPNFLNLFVHGVGLRFRAWPDLERIMVIGHDLKQICMKRFENYGMENQISSYQIIDSLAQIFYPNHSYIYIHANPNVHDLPAAPDIHNKTWVFWQKFQNWKLGYSAIQGQILIPLCSWSFKEGVWSKIIAWNSKNW